MTPSVPVNARCSVCDLEIVTVDGVAFERHGGGWRHHEPHCWRVLDEIAIARLRYVLDVVPADYTRCAIGGHVRIVEIERAAAGQGVRADAVARIRERLWCAAVERAIEFWREQWRRHPRGGAA